MTLSLFSIFVRTSTHRGCLVNFQNQFRYKRNILASKFLLINCCDVANAKSRKNCNVADVWTRVSSFCSGSIYPGNAARYVNICIFFRGQHEQKELLVRRIVGALRYDDRHITLIKDPSPRRGKRKPHSVESQSN